MFYSIHFYSIYMKSFVPLLFMIFLSATYVRTSIAHNSHTSLEAEHQISFVEPSIKSVEDGTIALADTHPSPGPVCGLIYGEVDCTMATGAQTGPVAPRPRKREPRSDRGSQTASDTSSTCNHTKPPLRSFLSSDECLLLGPGDSCPECDTPSIRPDPGMTLTASK